MYVLTFLMATWLNSTVSSLTRCNRSSIIRYFSSGVLPDRRPVRWPHSILEDDNAVIDLSEDNDIVNGARPNTPPLHQRAPPTRPTPSEYKAHRENIRKQFPDGWDPPRKLSREAMEGVRQLHKLDPEKFTTPMLAERFRISPEAIRRILRSKWEPSPEKKKKLAQKEREDKADVIRLSRMKERMEARKLFEIQESLRSGKPGISVGKTRGLDRSDRLELE